jgi:TPR repeat protein
MRIAILVIGAWLLGGGTAAAFSCTGAKLPWDLVVCSDPELRSLADQRLQAFEAAENRLNPTQIDQLREDQSTWVRSYSASCGVPANRPVPHPIPSSVIECFRDAGKARLAYLRAYGRQADAAPSAPSQTGAANTERNCKAALETLRPLALAGDPSDFRRLLAEKLLASWYLDGKCVPKDYSKAARWYRMAAHGGDASAQANLGLLYRNGRGVRQDDTEAVNWFRKSAEQGFAEGQFFLGSMYFKGEGVTKDLVEAVWWFNKAANQGDHRAQALLGGMYAGQCDCGGGIPKDYVRAYMWLNLAAAGGLKEAAELRDQIERSMTPQQVAEAQRQTEAWRPSAKSQ